MRDNRGHGCPTGTTEIKEKSFAFTLIGAMDRQGKSDLIPVKVFPVQRCGQRRALILVNVTRRSDTVTGDFRNLTLSPIEGLRVELILRRLPGKRIGTVCNRHLVLIVRADGSSSLCKAIDRALQVVRNSEIRCECKHHEDGDNQARA